MFVLYEAPAGYMVFKVLGSAKAHGSSIPDLHASFAADPSEIVKLHAFHKFEDTTEALAAATAIVDGKLDKSLRRLLKKNIKGDDAVLGTADSKLGQAIKKKLGIQCVNDNLSMELLRGIRGSLSSLLPALSEKDRSAMSLGLSHSLSRYKLKFSPDKVDTMIVQAINLLDELDKEVNTYAMRVREWYGWHFPEMARIINDNIDYAKCVLKAGVRTNFKHTDFSDILLPDVEETLKETCEISMGTEVSEDDIANVKALCTQVIELSAYRTKLFDYLKNRMAAIAPNLTVMVGELVGARLIAHAGSLMNLAKAPASTVQILGAEKALFRALKTKHDTPKYGLIYHASLIGQSAQKNKGKVSRVLAAKTALAIRVDALGEHEEATIGYECREKVEARMRQLETGQPYSLASTSAAKDAKKYDRETTVNGAAGAYNPAADVTSSASASGTKKKKKRKREGEQEEEAKGEEVKKKKKKQKDGPADDEGKADGDAKASPEKKKKKKKKKSLVEDITAEEDGGSDKKKKKKKKKKASAAAEDENKDGEPPKKKKKKKTKAN